MSATRTSTIQPQKEVPSSEVDPFRLGWRYVKVVDSKGEESWDQVPLTEEDILFPEEEDIIVNDDFHWEDLVYLRVTVKYRVRNLPGFVVLTDCRVDFNIPGVRPLGPDFVLFRNVSRLINWATFKLGDEGAEPLLALEVTSVSTRRNDLGIKKEFYRRAGVRFYVIVEAVERKVVRRLTFQGYRLTSRGTYARVRPDARGRIFIDSLNLWIGEHESRVRLYDGETGEVLPTPVESEEGRQEAVAQLQREAQARADAEARIRELEDELRRLKS